MKKWLLPGWRPSLFISTLIFVFSFKSLAQTAPPVAFVSVITGLDSPIDLVHAGDGTERIFIAQQGGEILVYDADFSLIGTFLTVTGLVSGGEQGLLSIAFDPDYANPDPEIGAFFYVYYTNSAGNLELARYHVSEDPDVADPLSKQVILTIPHPTNSNHNGAKLNFGSDGYLYFATGDGGSGGDPPNNAQRGDVLLGKMLRIDVTNSADAPFYTIPPGNPYAGPGDPLDEIWAFGLRNPFRWSFDRVTQDMWIGDVGQAEREEINFRAAGTTGGINYGWRCYEGNLPFNTSGCGPIGNYVFPVYDYENPNPGQAAVTGGVVYRGTNFPVLNGYYFATDVYSGDLYVINSTTFAATIQPAMPGAIVCFGETEAGEVYAVDLGGTIYSVAPDGALPVTLVLFTAEAVTGKVNLRWKTVSEQNLGVFEIEYSTDGINFLKTVTVPAKNEMDGAEYAHEHFASFTGRMYYRLKMVNLDGSFSYSSVVSVLLQPANSDFVHPSIIRDGLLQIFTIAKWETLEVVDMQGALVMKRQIAGQTGRIQVPLKPTMTGVYVVRLRNGFETLVQKILVQ